MNAGNCEEDGNCWEKQAAIRKTKEKLKSMQSDPDLLTESNLRDLLIDLDTLLATYNWRANDWFMQHLDFYNTLKSLSVPDALKANLIQTIGPFQYKKADAEPVNLREQHEEITRELLQQLDLYDHGERPITQKNMERLLAELNVIRTNFKWTPAAWFEKHLVTYNNIMLSKIDDHLKKKLGDIIGIVSSKYSVWYEFVKNVEKLIYESVIWTNNCNTCQVIVYHERH